MIVSSETKQAIVDSLAAIDLMTELLEEQRRMLEAALQPDQRPIEIGARPSEDGHRRHHHKGPPTTLNIRIDGHTISESQAAVGMVKAIGVIGPARVESLGLRLGGQPLIVRGARRPRRGYHRCGDYWVATHSDTAEKRNVLEKICQQLGLKGSIEQVAR
jgi:hypothetical protein